VRATCLIVRSSAARARLIAGCLVALMMGVCVGSGVAAEVSPGEDVARNAGVASGAIDAVGATAVFCPALPSIAQVLADDERLRDTHGFEEERVLRNFALFWYRNLATDLVDGNGAGFDVLAEAFRPACPQREALLVWLRELLLASETGTDFSRRLAMARAQAAARVQ
jgi:hypothetical protein